MNSACLQHQGVQIAMVHRGGQDDLGAGGAQLLELQDQVFQLGHAAAAHLDQEGIGTGDVVALQHLAAALQQFEKGVLLGGGHRQADEGVHIHAVGRAVQGDGVAADDAVGFQLMDRLETAGLVSATFSAISFTGIRAFFARRARILRSKSSIGKVLLLKYVTLSKIFRK